MSVTTFGALSLEDAFANAPVRDDGRVFATIRSDLDIEAFSVYAVRALADGVELVNPNRQTGPGGDSHEVVFFVVSGHAELTIHGETVDAPAGTFVFVRDPDAERSAVALTAGTTLLTTGGRRGEPWRMSAGEALNEFFALYSVRDYEGAAAVARQVLDEHPGNGLALFNLACAESVLGRKDDALAHLAAALDAAPSLKGNAQTDDDFAALRDDTRFRTLIAS